MRGWFQASEAIFNTVKTKKNKHNINLCIIYCCQEFVLDAFLCIAIFLTEFLKMYKNEHFEKEKFCKLESNDTKKPWNLSIDNQFVIIYLVFTFLD